MTITISKSLRKELKKEAKSRGVSVDELIAERLSQ
jgi:predicted HicB family RNase H-like nuclease